jgi:hypothetical protein
MMLTWTFSLMDMSRIPALHPAQHDARRGISHLLSMRLPGLNVCMIRVHDAVKINAPATPDTLTQSSVRMIRDQDSFRTYPAIEGLA